jgi:STAS-like domain of unknown function (DUF4325)
MIDIKISTNFTKTPGARYYSDGPFSGEEFYDKLLKKSYVEAVNQGVKLRVDLDGTDGYASSFLNEAFSRLGNEFGADTVFSNLIIISEEVPKYLKKVKESIYEKR